MGKCGGYATYEFRGRKRHDGLGRANPAGNGESYVVYSFRHIDVSLASTDHVLGRNSRAGFQHADTVKLRSGGNRALSGNLRREAAHSMAAKFGLAFVPVEWLTWMAAKKPQALPWWPMLIFTAVVVGQLS